MKLTFAIVSLLFIGIAQASEYSYCSQLTQDDDKPAEIIWYDFESAIDQNQKKKKFIFIDVYTSWCGWCKKMDQSTFIDKGVVEYMNEHFYSVKMDAESKDPIAFRETLYEHKMYNGKGYNELAVNLMGGKMSFPTFIVLSKREVKLGAINGFKKPKDLLLELKRFTKK